MDLAEDLYQELFLALCEIKDNRLIEAKEGGYLEVYCVGIIHNLWSKRGKVKTHNAGTNPMYCMMNEMTSIVPELASVTDQYNHNIDELYQKTQDIIEQKKESPDMLERYRARVFCYSREMPSIKDFARKSKIPYDTIRKANASFIQLLRQELCRNTL